MAVPEKLNRMFRVPRLTWPRIVLALGIAVAADGFQFLLNAFGWAGPDQIIDVVTMILISWLIGFHILLLPTFVVELIPVLDDLPTWIACTSAVIVLRKRDQRQPASTDKPVIDIQSEVK